MSRERRYEQERRRRTDQLAEFRKEHPEWEGHGLREDPTFGTLIHRDCLVAFTEWRIAKGYAEDARVARKAVEMLNVLAQAEIDQHRSQLESN